MTVRRPTVGKFRQISDELGLDISDQDLAEYRKMMDANFEMLDWLDAQPGPNWENAYPRTAGYVPEPDDNEFNAWAQKVTIPGAADGPLRGKRIAVKDNICVAGVPMRIGTSTLDTYVPDFDATVVTRVLDAGGEIAGKAKCENFCLTGNSHSNPDAHKVQNPHREGHTSGGSSSGCGALVGGGVVDMAIGGDQGGSIRVPSAWSGCVGLKPTHGLVPYTGAAALDFTVDHLGPMTPDVKSNAVLLEVIAGEDGLDPRQHAPRVQEYTAYLDRGPEGLRIGVLQEGFGHAESDPDVDELIRSCANLFGKNGASVEAVSIPEHNVSIPLWWPIAYQGFYSFGFEGNGLGTNWSGLYNLGLADALAGSRRRADEGSPVFKFVMLLGHYLTHTCNGRYYAMAQNRRHIVTDAYDRVLSKLDLILMPTLPTTAPGIPAPDCSIEEFITCAGNMAQNTICADLTGHPAISIPAGCKDGLPVGLMLVGRKHDESRLYQGAAAFEQLTDWRKHDA